MYGVDENESKITSTAGGGTLTLEFGILSRLTNNTVFERVTKKSVRGIWSRRSKLNLVGAHINVFTGEWTQKDAGIGTSIDSFYEYLLKERKATMFIIFGVHICSSRCLESYFPFFLKKTSHPYKVFNVCRTELLIMS